MNQSRKWAVISVAVVVTAVVVGVILPGMALWSPMWLKEFGVGPASVMAATTFNQIGSALIAPIVGYAVGRVISVRNLMLVGLALTAIALAGVASATAMWQVTLIHALLLSASVVLCGPVLCQVLAVRLFQENRGLAIGVVTAGVCLSTFTMPPLIGVLLDAGLSWRTVEFLMAGLVLALVPLVFFVVQEPPPVIAESDSPDATPEPTLGAREILSGRAFLATMLALIPLFILFNAIYYTLGLFLDRMGVTPTQVSILVGVAGFTATFGVISFGSLADRMSHWKLLAFSLVALTAGFLLVGAVKSYALMFVVIVILDFMIGGLSTLGPAIFAKRYGAANFARVSGLSRPFFAISSFSPLFAGYLHEELGSYPKVYMAMLVVLPLSYIGLALLGRSESAARRVAIAPVA